jgi:OOP family OmpA-OmpF porin
MKAAEEAQADTLFPHEFQQLEKTLKHAGKALEEGNQKEGIDKNASLANKFSALQLKALKTSASEQAEKAYKDAVAAQAKRLAPLTLKSAKRELDIARNILDVERSNYSKAKFHADRAKYLSLRAKHIAELLASFKADKLSDEQVVLWYQDQLAKIHTPMPEELNFDMQNRAVVNTFENDIANHIQNLKEAEARALVSEKKIALLSEKLQAGPGRTLMEQATWEENFREISDLFNKKEAEVVRRDHDIIIRAYGFYFPVGKADLLTRNFTLMHKIVAAVLKFPRADIEVEGHTDSTGSKSLNMRLSAERAKNVAEFLVKLAGIDASRVTSVGVGGERPIASNDTEKGRAKNRRIEIIIKPHVAKADKSKKPVKK